MSTEKTAVEILIEKAQNSEKSEDAIRFSQAACNVINAQRTVKETGKM